jgi:tRNA(Ile)-lysidine synthase
VTPSLPARARRTIRRHELFRRGARVLVALSGGPDSVALLHVLRALERDGDLIVAGIGHFNHRLRGAAADEDERFCRDLADAWGLAIAVGSADVANRARTARRSIEDMARRLRYGFLEEAAAAADAEVIAVGHTLDDQAETFLLRLIRGAGARGLAGIRPRAGRIVRPLIEISRADVRGYVEEHGLAFRVDETNRDVGVPRNRVRHELIPILQGYSSRIVPVLAREATLARQDEEFLHQSAIDLAAAIVLWNEYGADIDADALRGLPPALASRVARLALERTAPGRFIGFQHIERLIDLAGGPVGASAALPGLLATRAKRTVVLTTQPGRAPFSNSFRFPLSIPGEVSAAGWTVTAEPIDDRSCLPVPPARAGVALIPVGSVQFPLAVRSRRPGDRFRPLGMGGRGRKLQDFLTDRKVARAERDSLPLVVDRDDRIVWVVGQSVAEDFRITAPQQGVILLKARRLGGVG